MKAPGNITIYLKDYKPPHFRIQTVALSFELHEDHCRVTNRMSLTRDNASPFEAHLELNGEALTLESVRLDGQPLNANEFESDTDTLKIFDPPTHFEVEIVTRIQPQLNTELQGLYKSGSLFCTQNEPEGFRRITFFLDRPDVMAVYTTRIEADRQRYPVLLSNGNRTAGGDLPQGRHWVEWHDPFPKPCYLFALVAGDLGRIQDTFTTHSGRQVALEIYCDKGNEPRCLHAMDSLKRSMLWDEQRFGLEYDLDIFMIVAVEDFNSGAMENKGLNIFNARYILADPKVATDTDYEMIESVVAHEYFHNWTGNRVTCRDWFQLSLKEGLTVFRDQEFSIDMGAGAVRRIGEVTRLRTLQFAEDAGPMAHPIRPASYMEINNFYTTTVYEKGAEVIRMIQMLVGRDGFRRGIDKYFELFDGQAVTTEDFIHAMETANKVDLTQFKLWYNQAGTPLIEVTPHYDSAQQRFSLTLKQSCRPTPETPHKQPFHLPVKVGLLDAQGKDLIPSQVLELKKEQQTFTFDHIREKPVVSVLREFSAPVNLQLELSDDELLFLMAHDSDLFNRWDASQQVVTRHLLRMIEDVQLNREMRSSQPLIEAYRRILSDPKLDPAFCARVLTLPAETVFLQKMKPVDPMAIHKARRTLLKQMALALTSELTAVYRAPIQTSSTYTTAIAGQRSLRNQALAWLTSTELLEMAELALQQLKTTNNMTDEMAALVCLAASEHSQKQEGLELFYQKWKHESLVLNKWLQAQAAAPLPTTSDHVERLVSHPAFDMRNPNKVMSLLVVFGRDNLFGFHSRPEHSYSFMADQILKLDQLNPQVSSRVASAFNYWRLFDQDRQRLMKAELERIRSAPQLSKNVYEIVAKTLDCE